MNPQFLTETEVHQMLNVPLSYLRKLRHYGGKDPIPFTKIGRTVRYSVDKLNKWIQRNTFYDTQEAQEHQGK